jgi:hypothetical protein
MILGLDWPVLAGFALVGVGLLVVLAYVASYIIQAVRKSRD